VPDPLRVRSPRIPGVEQYQPVIEFLEAAPDSDAGDVGGKQAAQLLKEAIRALVRLKGPPVVAATFVGLAERDQCNGRFIESAGCLVFIDRATERLRCRHGICFLY